MSSSAPHPDEAESPGASSLADDEAALAAYAQALADGVAVALPGWVTRCVQVRARQWGGPVDGDVEAAAEAAALAAASDTIPAVRDLLATDIDEQRTNPLALVRAAVVHPTTALRRLGVPPVVRDAQAEAQFPGDDYDLVPGSFADVDPSLFEPGLAWGAAKAHVHLRRRRQEGRR